jgi:hypothetical protein
MRDISRKVCGAFVNRQAARLKSTATDGTSLTLHGHEIARWREDGTLIFTLAGWNTPTTRDRLNTVFHFAGMPLRVHQLKHMPYVRNYYQQESTGIETREIYRVSDFA